MEVKIMTKEQAEAILATIPTDRELAIDFAKKMIKEGMIEQMAKYTHYDTLISKEFETAFFEYYHAWKLVNEN
jgi:hypothetical protein